MFKATVNHKTFEISNDGDSLVVNGDSLDWDIVPLREGYYHILHKGRSYRAELVKADEEHNIITWKINGHLYSVSVKDKFDMLLEQMGMTRSAGSKINSVKAPMPGMIIDLKVKTGDEVKQGDPLLILEAMKMENIIKAAGNGTVKSLKVKKGDSVEKGQVLIEFM
jgi:biotin carboxyl carrier protein